MSQRPSIAELTEELVDEFSLFDDWMDRYEHLISLGKSLPLIDEQYKNDEHLIRGCQSDLWMHAEPLGERLHFSADTDAIIPRGLVGLVLRVLNDQPADDIAKADLDFINAIGLEEHLSPTRANGLRSLIKQMKLYGLAHAARLNASSES